MKKVVLIRHSNRVLRPEVHRSNEFIYFKYNTIKTPLTFGVLVDTIIITASLLSRDQVSTMSVASTSSHASHLIDLTPPKDLQSEPFPLQRVHMLDLQKYVYRSLPVHPCIPRC